MVPLFMNVEENARDRCAMKSSVVSPLLWEITFSIDAEVAVLTASHVSVSVPI